MSNRRLSILASIVLTSLIACSDEEETVPDADSDVTSDASDGSGGDVALDTIDDAIEPDAIETDADELPDTTGPDADDTTPDAAEDTTGDDVLDADTQEDAADTTDPDTSDAGDGADDADTGPVAPPNGDCMTDADCGDGLCLPINGVEGGWMSCQFQPVEADVCPDLGGAFESECCNSSECNGGAGSICVRGPLFYCGGAFPGDYNLCATPLCTTSSDCNESDFCLDGGFYGEPAALCTPSGCETHADCTDGDGGQCRPFFTECGNRFDGLRCTYDDSPCRSSEDCPPADGFPQVCQWDKTANSSFCMPSIPRP